MGKTYLKRLTTLIISFGIILSLLTIVDINNVKAENVKKESGPETTDTITIDEKGNVSKLTFEEATKKTSLSKFRSSQDSVDYVSNPKSGAFYVAHLNSSSGKNKYLTYENALIPGKTGYTTGAYGLDGAYIGTFNGKYRVMQSGVLMDFKTSDVKLVEYSNAKISYYKIVDGYLVHYIYSENGSNAIRVGYKLNYLKEKTKYYSYDGHYFYTDYPTMVSDYQKNSRAHSINPNNPYYNYYQYLSHRSKTAMTASMMNNIVVSKVGDSPSKMKNLGDSFIEVQNNYGVNAVLMFGLAGNESNWGRSGIAMNKNNLFGHNATDNNPYGNADTYKSPIDSIKYHADEWIDGYAEVTRWKYNGSHLGDKLSGMSVEYASDPYWGEKAASVNYYYDVKSDYGYNTIGVINGSTKGYSVYKDPSYSAPIVYTFGKNDVKTPYDLPILILDTIKDNAGNTWYKIQSDTALTNDRSNIDKSQRYSFSRDYVYIPAKNITVINKGDVTIPSYYTGDVNGDGKVSSLDYIQIKNHIMKTKVLSDSALLRADVNGDGKVSSLDYIKIKNHIMGTNKLF